MARTYGSGTLPEDDDGPTPTKQDSFREFLESTRRKKPADPVEIRRISRLQHVASTVVAVVLLIMVCLLSSVVLSHRDLVDRTPIVLKAREAAAAADKAGAYATLPASAVLAGAKKSEEAGGEKPTPATAGDLGAVSQSFVGIVAALVTAIVSLSFFLVRAAFRLAAGEDKALVQVF